MQKFTSATLLSFLLLSCSWAPSPTRNFSKSNTAEANGQNGNELPSVETTGDNGSGTSGVIMPAPGMSTSSEAANPDLGSDAAMCGMSAPAAPQLAATVPGQMIRTVSGGRVRQRHESNGTHASFGDHYFENRSYEFIIEDYTPTGDKRVVITLKPIGIHGTGQGGDAGLPNFRVFQNGGTNPDLFNSNNTFKDNGDNTFTFEIKDNGGNAQQSLATGRMVSFEFGFFFNKTKVEGRNSYYSDTFRFIVGKPGMVVGVPLTDGVAGDPQAMAPIDSLSGGQHSVALVKAEQDQAFHYSQSSLNISGKDMQTFLEGRSLFHSNFVSGKHSEEGIEFSAERVAKQQNLAGPSMDAAACSSCHTHNGTFAVGESDHPDHILKVMNNDGSINEKFGLQLQKSEVAASGIKKTAITKDVVLEDGTKFTLTAPKYSMDGSAVSARIPQMVYGLGLLEAVSNEQILSRASCDPKGAGISGKASLAMNPKSGQMALGRFGWKAGKVSLEHQVSEAALLDMGVTSPLFPSDECEKTGKCVDDKPELPQDDIDRLVGYMRAIAVPVQRNTTDPKFVNGRKTFDKLGCGGCHLPTQYTGNTHPVEKLRNQTFHPFTDLLLHDLGPDMADGKAENNASGSEWRTAPLWGIGLMKTVNGQTQLLHDGRAKSIEEAILWHGGEAAPMSGGYRGLPKAERDDLLFFLNSI